MPLQRRRIRHRCDAIGRRLSELTFTLTTHDKHATPFLMAADATILRSNARAAARRNTASPSASAINTDAGSGRFPGYWRIYLTLLEGFICCSFRSPADENRHSLIFDAVLSAVKMAEYDMRDADSDFTYHEPT